MMMSLIKMRIVLCTGEFASRICALCIGCIKGPLHQEQCHSFFFLSYPLAQGKGKSFTFLCVCVSYERNVTHPSDLEQESGNITSSLEGDRSTRERNFLSINVFSFFGDISLDPPFNELVQVDYYCASFSETVRIQSNN